MRTLSTKFMTTAALLLAAACGGSGTVSIKLTDAPGDFLHAFVTITEVDLVGSGGVTVLATPNMKTDLLTLSNATADLVSGAVVSSGSYSELRFKISGGYIEVAQTGGGSIIYASSPTYAGLPAGATVGGVLQMPSLAQSGLKVDLPGGGVNVGTDSKILLVDFDVSQSFGHVAGNSGDWVMHPVMKATDFTLSGNLNVTLKLAPGVTLPMLVGAQVTLTEFTAVLKITNSDSTVTTKTQPFTAGATAGTVGASFLYLFPGSNYSLNLVSPAGMSFTSSPAVPVATVTIAPGAATAEDFTLTAASAP